MVGREAPQGWLGVDESKLTPRRDSGRSTSPSCYSSLVSGGVQVVQVVSGENVLFYVVSGVVRFKVFLGWLKFISTCMCEVLFALTFKQVPLSLFRTPGMSKLWHFGQDFFWIPGVPHPHPPPTVCTAARPVGPLRWGGQWGEYNYIRNWSCWTQILVSSFVYLLSSFLNS